MPIYEYECENSDVHQLFSPPTVHSGEATDVVEETAEQVQEEQRRQRTAFDQGDLREAL
ncbi:MAG: hypothetical protein PVH50_11440 [Anaerolineae bacterium]|jgi:hypothetical protein